MRHIRQSAVKLLLLTLYTITATSLISEGAVRLLLPQDLSGWWLVQTENGLIVNKSSGSARHQFGNRIVYYNFHEPHLRDTKIQKEAVRILVLGDSFTFGWLLDNTDTYVHHLQEFSDSLFGKNIFQFLNGSVGGWGASDYIAFTEDFQHSIKPDIILIYINTDDIGRSIRSKLYTITEDGALVRCFTHPSNFKKIINTVPGYGWLLEHSHLTQLIRKSLIYRNENSSLTSEKREELAIRGPGSSESTDSSESIRLGQALYLRLKKLCDANKIHLLLTTTGWHDLDEADDSTEPTKAFMHTASIYFRSIGVPYFDISPFVAHKKSIEALTIPGDGHPNESGSKLIAEKSWQLFLRYQLDGYRNMSHRD